MTSPRFKSLGVEIKGGRKIVTLEDSVTGEKFSVYRKGSRLRRWNQTELLVRNRAAQRVAKEAMEEASA